MKFTIETPRLILKTLDTSWGGAVAALYEKNSEWFGRYEGAYPENYFTADYQSMMLDGNMQMFMRCMSARYFVFLKKQPDEMIGCLGFTNMRIGPDKTAMLFYKLDRDYCGQGYMSEAVEALMNVAHAEHGIRRFEADVLASNTPSKRLLDNLGFEFEGVAKRSHMVGTKYVDHERYALIL